MKGIELSEKFFEEFGRPMIENEFGEYADRICAGLVGHGSECFGFDDGLSRDHDFGAGFCLWITEEDERRFGFRLFRAYEKLPKDYGGVVASKKSLFGGDAKGVQTIEGFYKIIRASRARRKRFMTGSIRRHFILRRRQTAKSSVTHWENSRK